MEKMSEKITPEVHEPVEQVQHPLVNSLRTRAKYLKIVSTLYLVLILTALGGGGYLFYWLPQILAGQEAMLSQVQQLSIQKGALETSETFVLSRWERQRNNARKEFFLKGQTITSQADYSVLRSVVFTDANIGWAVGVGGTILTTADGGTTWASQQSGTNNHLNSVVFTDANMGWAVGFGGTIRKITVPNDAPLAAAKTLAEYSHALGGILNK